MTGISTQERVPAFESKLRLPICRLSTEVRPSTALYRIASEETEKLPNTVVVAYSAPEVWDPRTEKTGVVADTVLEETEKSP